MSQPVWELRSITKRFPGVVANDGVSLEIRAGEIHGLLGENGCGKSTLIKILCGVHQADSGEIRHRGAQVVLENPIAARTAGIATVFQEFSLVPALSVAENIHLGRPPKRGLTVDWRAMRDGARAIIAQMDVAIDPDRTVDSLSVAEQQLVEIAKALAAEASMIILDEPTTALGRGEIARLHGLLRRLRQGGCAIVYISHRLDEVVELVDRVTILKDGRVVANAQDCEVSVAHIVRVMVGKVSDHYPKQHNARETTALELRDVHTGNRINGVSFTVRHGEVFGLGGVLGSGRTELARALFGLDRLTRGEIVWKGRPCAFRGPREAIAAGLALVPENRKFDGLFFNFTGLLNISAAALPRLGRHGTIGLKREAAAGRALIEALAISPAAEEREVGLLSGGNQQKIIIARWLFAGAELFILDEPTQGIDIGARIAVYELINRITAEGKSVILISSDHSELIRMSDRVGLMSQGRIVDVKPAQQVTTTDLIRISAPAIGAAA
ncbi:MAG: sugar ABC transporter ATP-binding protein [Parvibaculaceae bacterium]